MTRIGRRGDPGHLGAPGGQPVELVQRPVVIRAQDHDRPLHPPLGHQRVVRARAPEPRHPGANANAEKAASSSVRLSGRPPAATAAVASLPPNEWPIRCVRTLPVKTLRYSRPKRAPTCPARRFISQKLSPSPTVSESAVVAASVFSWRRRPSSSASSSGPSGTSASQSCRASAHESASGTRRSTPSSPSVRDSPGASDTGFDGQCRATRRGATRSRSGTSAWSSSAKKRATSSRASASSLSHPWQKRKQSVAERPASRSRVMTASSRRRPSRVRERKIRSWPWRRAVRGRVVTMVHLAVGGVERVQVPRAPCRAGGACTSRSWISRSRYVRWRPSVRRRGCGCRGFAASVCSTQGALEGATASDQRGSVRTGPARPIGRRHCVDAGTARPAT